MNSRFKLIKSPNQRDYKPNVLTSTLKKTSSKYRFSKFSEDRTRIKQSKAAFNDSDDDCEIIQSSPEELHNRNSSSINSNSFVNIRNNINKITPISNSEKARFPHFQTNGMYKTPEEKYQLLDDLDNSYSSDLGTVDLDRPSLAGICQDMCPEKERYWKEFQDTVSIFEKDENDQFDHRKAVKGYERCSADQKEPQPHELRATDVLDRTMDYLLKHVVDHEITKQSWRQWYTFLWARTRAIRKDIAQQNLCNITVIKIIETITRFHIFCGERLCEESKDDFEKKYNDENLKNCLQSLKDMYGDMPINSCKNEAEFRGYMIMMNADKGETLYEAQKLSDAVFRSNEVKFALRIYQAYNSYNYVKFFRLIQSADFITSCLLHRFIVDARLKALTVINKAYVANKSGENQVPLGYFYKVLGFENLEQSCEFCKEIGFTLTTDNGNSPAIILNGSAMSKNADEVVKRAFKLVENKQGNYKLSSLFSRVEEFDTDRELMLPCKMISFNDRGHYIGSLKFPVKKSNIASNELSDKNNFDLSDSDYNVPRYEERHESPNRKLFVERLTKESHPTYASYLQSKGNINTGSLFTSKDSQTKVSSGDIKNSKISIFSPQNKFLIDNNIKSTYDNESVASSVPYSMSSNQTSQSNTLFYLPSNQPSISSESNQSEDDYPIISKDIIDNCALIINNELIDELTEESISQFISKEKRMVLHCNDISDVICNEIITETLNNAIKSIMKDCRESISEEYIHRFISETVSNIYKEKQEAFKKKNASIDKRIKTLKRSYFKHWKNFTTMNIKERKSLAKLPAGPRMADDFTICEDFHGKVRKISTKAFISNDVYWNRHPIMSGLEQMTKTHEYLPREIIQNDSMTQTDITYADISNVRLNCFIGQFIEQNFFKVLNSQLRILEFSKQVDPHPEKIILYYNSLIDIIDFTTEGSVKTSVSSFMKLPLINLDVKPLSNWNIYMQNIFKKLEVPLNERSLLFDEICATLKYLNNSQELPELSYYHLRLFPWIKIMKISVLNKLSLMDNQYGDFRIDIDSKVVDECRIRLKPENTLDGLSIENCVRECNLHINNYKPRIVKTPRIQNSKRLTAFNDLIKKVTELEMKIDECK